jgi:FkbM family methyltransferase
MIVNRNDWNDEFGAPIGVGYQVLEHSGCEQEEVDLALGLLMCRRALFGDGVFAIDGGANIGTHTIEWARLMYGWGSTLSFEAQETIYYALAGNIAINNCLNARARLAALGAASGELLVPQPDYYKRGSFGSVEYRRCATVQDVGQDISYDADRCETVEQVALDDLQVNRLDFLKLDVEGMEADVLRGGAGLIDRCRPVIMVEHCKSDKAELKALLEAHDYRCHEAGINFVAFHASDPTSKYFKVSGSAITLGIPQLATA